MSNAKPSSAKADDLTKQLQASLAQRRPRPWKIVLAALAISTLSLLLLAWLLYPQPPELVLLALAPDALFTANETPLAQAQLLLPPEEEDVRRLRGQSIAFQEIARPGEKPRDVVKQSDQQGQASVEWRAPPGVATEFLARYINVALRQGSLADRGWICVWPKDVPLLVVDADETLIAEQLDERAASKLQEAAKKGWRIAYLSLASGQANDYRLARRWLETHPKLPKGPALGRRHYPSEASAGQARRETLQSLQGRFEGPIVFIVKSADAAQAGKELGLRTFVIGSETTPAWSDLRLETKE